MTYNGVKVMLPSSKFVYANGEIPTPRYDQTTYWLKEGAKDEKDEGMMVEFDYYETYYPDGNMIVKSSYNSALGFKIRPIKE